MFELLVVASSLAKHLFEFSAVAGAVVNGCLCFTGEGGTSLTEVHGIRLHLICLLKGLFSSCTLLLSFFARAFVMAYYKRLI